MMFDSDVLVWCCRGHPNALAALNSQGKRQMSVVVAMELTQGALNRTELAGIQRVFRRAGVEIIPLSPTIGALALSYLEQYALAYNIKMGDALIAATAVLNRQPLMSGNVKDLHFIPDLDLRPFRLNQ